MDLDIERMVVAGEQYEPVMCMADNKKPLTTKESDAKEKLETKMVCESVSTECSKEGGET